MEKSEVVSIDVVGVLSGIRSLATEKGGKVIGSTFDSLPKEVDKVTVTGDFEKPFITKSGFAGALLPVKAVSSNEYNGKGYKLFLGEQISGINTLSIGNNVHLVKDIDKGYITKIEVLS